MASAISRAIREIASPVSPPASFRSQALPPARAGDTAVAKDQMRPYLPDHPDWGRWVGRDGRRSCEIILCGSSGDPRNWLVWRYD
jgi:hypothetical protein